MTRAPATATNLPAFAARLRAIRVERGLTQAALANQADLDDKKISSYERGRNVPDQVNLLKLFAGLGLDEGDLDRAALQDAWSRSRKRTGFPRTSDSDGKSFAGRSFLPQGREAQIAHLSAVIAEPGKVCLVTGEGGAGKSSLIEHAIDQVRTGRPNLLVIQDACRETDLQSGTLQPMLRLLGHLLDPESSPWAVIASTVRALLGQPPALLKSVITDRLQGVLLSPGSRLPKPLREELTDNLGYSVTPTTLDGDLQLAIERTLNGIANQFPVLLILEDLHWAHPALIEFCLRLATGGRAAFYSIWFSSRTRAGLGGVRTIGPDTAAFLDVPGLQHIDMDLSIGGDDGRTFCDAYLAQSSNQFDDAFGDWLFQRTGGQAMFVREMMEWLVTGGWLTRHQTGFWLIAKPLPVRAVPTAISQAIRSHLASLEPDARDVLVAASLQGTHFVAEAAFAAAAIPLERMPEIMDDVLTARDLVEFHERVPVSDSSLHVYRFRHDHYRHYAQQSLLPIHTEHLHRATAISLGVLYGIDRDKHEGEIGWHWEAGGQPVEASRAYRHIGNWLHVTGQVDQAISWYDRALGCLPPDYRGAERSRTLVGKAGALRRTTRRRDSYDLCVEALHDAELFGTQEDIANAELQLGVILFDGRNVPGAIEFLERALVRVKDNPQYTETAQITNFLSHAAFAQGRYDDAMTYATAARNFATTAGNRFHLAESLVAGANCLLDTGRFKDAVSQFREAINVFSTAGDQRGVCLALLNIALCHIEMGNAPEALEALDRIDGLMSQGTLTGPSVPAMSYRAMLEELRGNLDKAESLHAEVAVRHRGHVAEHPLAIDADAGLIRIAVRKGERERARSFLDSIDEWCRDRDLRLTEYPIRICLSCARAAQFLRLSDVAIQWIERGHAILQERAQCIIDPEMRRSFLDIVPINREIRHAWAEIHPHDQHAP